jgi:site-specific recombinase XerD
VALYLGQLAPGSSRRTMRYCLTLVAAMFGERPETLDWARLRYEHVAAIRTRLMETRAPATANLALCAVRGVLRQAWRTGRMDTEAFHRAVDVPGVRGEGLPRGRALNARELRRLFRACACDRSAIGRRDEAILAVMYSTGLRRAEIVGLDLDDYDPATGELRVDGKGGKQRMAYVVGGAKQALEGWLKARGTEPGALFWPSDGRGRPLVNRRMTAEALFLMLRRRTRQARVAPCSPHDVRRTFISDLLDAGADIVTVQNLAGHADVSTTARYDRRGEEAQRRAADLLQVPFGAVPDTGRSTRA